MMIVVIIYVCREKINKTEKINRRKKTPINNSGSLSPLFFAG